MRFFSRRTGLASLVALALSWAAVIFPAAPVADAVTKPSLPSLQARAVYYLTQDQDLQRQIMVSTMAGSSSFQSRLWSTFLNRWENINSGMTMPSRTPKGLPSKGHVFIVLGSALTKSGGMTTKLERRLILAQRALAAYPNSKVLVSGGAKKNGKTEAAVMRSWLIDKGISSSRILLEAGSSSTIGNAKYSMALLAKSSNYTSYTLVTDASHMRRASVLFEAAKLLVQQKSGKKWSINARSSLAYPDLTGAGKSALSTSSVDYTATNVVSLLGLSSQFNDILDDPPAPAKLTSLVTKAPTKTDYRVGQTLDRAGMAATAKFSGGAFSLSVTAKLKVTGFSTATRGTRTATLSYTQGGVTKKAKFTYTVRKAISSAILQTSTTKITRNRTKVKVTAKIRSATTPTGTVKFYLDGKKVGSAKLTRSTSNRNLATARLTYPKITKTGKHTIKITYSGSSKVLSSAASAKAKVKK